MPRDGTRAESFYRWQKTFFENGAKAFETSRNTTTDVKDRRITALKAKLGEKDGVISELVTELIQSKNKNGDL